MEADLSHCIAMTTLDDQAVARKLARGVVEARLGACVQILTIQSVYRWVGAVTDAPEYLLLIKTRTSVYAELQAFIEEHHPYEVPEIVQVPITAGLGAYLGWIDESTSPAHDD